MSTQLAEALKERMNQIEGTTGMIGGWNYSITYNSDTNNFTFTKRNYQEETQQSKFERTSKFDLDNVDLGVGTV